VPLPVSLSPDDADLIEALLRNKNKISAETDRIYFLTITPMDQWSDDGKWRDLPPEFHKRISDLAINYRPASQAHLRDGSVFERRTNATAWMQWITIKRWISPSEVEVEEGVWCCPLGGGAHTTIYKKENGRWEIKQLGPGWVS